MATPMILDDERERLLKRDVFRQSALPNGGSVNSTIFIEGDLMTLPVAHAQLAGAQLASPAGEDIQGYLAHKKPQPPRTLQEDCAYGPVAVPGGKGGFL